ncbi:putative serine/threonine protein kinase [Blattamonas nauphoetae]|uniref:Serine/threonine protein kinase n=1 Tax=Blattamonas nauphoetae TaxID=2049346 RepID=A0ABQ9XFM6_9EUKA|nr:putative serine/threonine protein kinase [Blattamonas nauphoetae]
MQDYNVFSKIGEGKNSTCYVGRKKHTSQYYCIKSVDKSQKEQISNEVKIMHMLIHPNIVRFTNWYETTNHIWVILELCSGGDLKGLLKQDRRLPETTIRSFSGDIRAALHYLHSVGVIFGDLRPANVLFNPTGTMKLCDFKLSIRVSDARPQTLNLQKFKNSLPYLAPELLKPHGLTTGNAARDNQNLAFPFSYASDFWALGCLLYELAEGKTPFEGKNQNETVHNILTKSPVMNPKWSPEFSALLRGLLAKSPILRLGWPEIGYHPFWVETLYPIQTKEHTEYNILIEALKKTQQSGNTAESDSDDDNSDSDESDVSLSSSVGASRNMNEDRYTKTLQKKNSTPVDTTQRTISKRSEQFGDLIETLQAPSMHSLVRQLSTHQNAQKPGNTDTSKKSTRQFQSFHPQLIWNTETDLTAFPIALNKKIEKYDIPPYDARKIPFDITRFNTNKRLKKTESDSLVSSCVSVLKTATSTSNSEKVTHTLSFLLSLCVDSDIPTVLLNSLFGILVLELLRDSRVQSSLRQTLILLLSLLLRYTRSLSQTVWNAKVGEVILNSIKNGKSEKEKRWGCAAIGELLFYLCSQTGQIGQSEQKTAVDSVPILLQTLKQSSDPIAQHYVAKTIDNVASLPIPQDGTANAIHAVLIRRLALPDFVDALSALFITTQMPSLKATALSAISRLVRMKEKELGDVVVHRIGLDILASVFVTDTQKQAQIASANLILMLLTSHPSFSTDTKPSITLLTTATPSSPHSTAFISFVFTESFVTALHDALNKAPSIVTSKALLLLSVLVKVYPALFTRLTSGLVSTAIKQLREEETYEVSCLHSFVDSFCGAATLFLQSTTLFMSSSLSSLNLPPLTATQTLHTIPPDINRSLTSISDSLSLILTALSSSLIRPHLISTAFILAISNIVTSLITPHPHTFSVSGNASPTPQPTTVTQSSSSDARKPITLSSSILPDTPSLAFHLPSSTKDPLLQFALGMAETMGQSDDTVLLFLQPLSSALLPALFGMICEDNPDLRFVAVKTASDLVVTLFDGVRLLLSPDTEQHSSAVAPATQQEWQAASSEALSLIKKHIVSNADTLLSDEDPIPLYVLKILAAGCRLDSHFVTVLDESGVVEEALHLFTPTNQSNNIHNMSIVRYSVSSGLVPVERLFKLGIVEKTVAVLKNTVEKEIAMLSEVVIEIVYSLLYTFLAPPPTLTTPQLTQHLVPLLSAFPSILTLVASLLDEDSELFRDYQIADVSCACVGLICKCLLVQSKEYAEIALTRPACQTFNLIFSRLAHFMTTNQETVVSVVGLRRISKALLNLVHPFEKDSSSCPITLFLPAEIKSFLSSVKQLSSFAPLSALMNQIITSIQPYS